MNGKAITLAMKWRVRLLKFTELWEDLFRGFSL